MKIIGSDYDGTMRIDGEVKQSTIVAIKQFQQDGNKFGLVTGRSSESTRKEIKEHAFNFDFVVCNNGGVIFDKDMQLLQLSLIDFKKAKQVIDFVCLQGCDYYVLNDGVRRGRCVINPEFIDFHNSGAGSCDIQTLIKAEKIAQIVVGFNQQEQANALAATLNHDFEGFINAYANLNCVDIVPVGVSKASGLAYVVEHYGYHKEDTYSIGDSYNDISMLKAFDGSALSHSPQEVKQAATYVSDSVDAFIDVVRSL